MALRSQKRNFPVYKSFPTSPQELALFVCFEGSSCVLNAQTKAEEPYNGFISLDDVLSGSPRYEE